MKRSLRILVLAAVAALVCAGLGTSRPTQDILTPPELLLPAAGQTFTAGSPIVFRIRTFPEDPGYLWLHVSSTPTPADTCGTIADDTWISDFGATADPTVYEARTADYTQWILKPGTYYWQAYRIHYGDGADGCIESEVRSLTITAKPAPAPKPVPKPAPTTTPTPTPKPTPKAPLALAKARLAGPFTVNERVASASGSIYKVGARRSLDWKFTPKCSSGPCATRMSFEFVHPSHPFSGSHVARVALTKKGSVYTGRSSAPLAECMMTDVTGTITLRLSVTKGAWINARWRATQITGTATYAIPYATTGAFYCNASKYTTTLKGTLQQSEL